MALNTIASFLNGANTYVIYWNDITAEIDVYKNAVLITSDVDSPISHAGVGFYSIYSFCNVRNLVRFLGIADFPYYEKEIEVNSPSCSIVYCDIKIDTPVATVNETIAGNNGQIQATATSSNGTPQYSLNLTDWQVSGTFTGLTAGIYTVYARDGSGTNNCLDTATVEVVKESSYGALYNFFYTNDLGEEVKVEIAKKDYSATTETLTAGETPLVISWGKQDSDKYEVIKASSVIIQVVSDSFDKFQDLYEAQEKDYQIRVYKNETLDWIGYLLPYQYLQTFSNPPFVVSFEATDGLASLKNEPFKNSETELFEDVKSIFTIYKYILNKLNFRLDIREGCRTFEVNQATSNFNSPFNQTFVNLEAFIIDKEKYKVLSCYDVLEAIFKPFGCRVFQSGGLWWIQQVNEIISSYIVRKTGYNGTSYTIDTFTPAVATTAINDKNLFTFIDRSAVFQATQAYKQITVERAVVLKNQLIEGGDFLDTDWLESGENKFWANYPIIQKGSEGAMFFDGGNEENADYIETAAIEIAAGIYTFSFSYRFVPTTQDASGNSSRVYAQIEIDTGGTVYYVDTVGDIVTTNNTKIESIVTEYNKDITFSIDFELTEAQAGSMKVRIFQGVGNDVICKTLYLSKVNLSILIAAGEGSLEGSKNPSSNLEYTFQNLNTYSYIPDNIELLLGDAEASSLKLVDKGALQLSDGSLTENWKRSGSTEAIKLAQSLAVNIIQNNKRTAKRLNGTLAARGNKRFSFKNTLYISSIFKYFILNYLSINDKKAFFEVDATELLSEEFLDTDQFLYPDGLPVYTAIGSDVYTKPF